MATRYQIEWKSPDLPSSVGPASALFAEPIELAVLTRQGRLRPVACQGEPFRDQTRLWWIAEPAVGDVAPIYELRLEGRRRQPPPRMRIEPGAAGWTVSRRRRPVAELLFPTQGLPRVSLLGPGADVPVRLATVSPVPHRVGGEPLHRLRIAAPAVLAGPVFADFNATYDFLDQREQVVFRESHHLRAFDAPDAGGMLEWTVDWHAVAGNIVLMDGYGQHLPSLRIEPAPSVTGTFWGDNGRQLRPADSCPPNSRWIALGEGAAVGILAHPDNAGFPPRIEADGGAWRLMPRFPPESLLRGVLRLSLGNTLRQRFRLVYSWHPDAAAVVASAQPNFEAPAQFRVTARDR